MIARTFDLLADQIFGHVIANGQSQVVRQQGNHFFPSACRQSKREAAFLSRVEEIVLESFVDAANDSS